MSKITVKTIAKNVLKYALVAVVLYFVYLQLAKNWDELVRYEWQIHIPTLILSIVVHLFTFLLLSNIWCILIRSFGHKVKIKDGFKIAYIANLGRYIPGKIWQVFGMVYYARKLGIKEETAVTSWVTAMVFSLPSAFLVGVILVLISPELLENRIVSDMGIGFYITIGALFVLSLLMIFLPNKTLSILNIFLRIFKRPQIEFKIDIKTALTVYIGYVIAWICYGFAFWLFVISITSNMDLPVIPTIGSFVLAYQIGYLAFFAPGGVGVRELVLTGILSPYLGPISAGIAIGARVWNMVVEIAAALIAWFIKISKNNTSNSEKR